MGQTECKGCTGSDPTNDTVKVNPTLLAEAGSGVVKQELPQPTGTTELEEERLRQEAEAEAEEQRLRQEAEAAELRCAQEEAEALRRSQQEEAEALRRAQQAAGQQAAREERERQAAEAKARADEQARLAAEQEERQRLEAKAVQDAKAKTAIFLKAHGFKSVSAPKTGCMTVTYPLHVAVKENQVETVAALLKCGADRSAKNSAKKTPLQLAETLNKKGSHAAIIKAFA